MQKKVKKKKSRDALIDPSGKGNGRVLTRPVATGNWPSSHHISDYELISSPHLRDEIQSVPADIEQGQ